MLPGKKYTPDDYARMAWRRRWYIAIPVVVIASATFVVSIFLPDRYRASTSILIVPQRVPENFVRPTVTADLSERLDIIRAADPQPHSVSSGSCRSSTSTSANASGSIMEDVIERMRRDIGVNVARPARRRDHRQQLQRLVPSGQRHERPCASPSAWRRCSCRRTRRTGSCWPTRPISSCRHSSRSSKRRLIEQERKLQEFRTRNNGQLPDQVQSNLQMLQGAQSRLQIARRGQQPRSRSAGDARKGSRRMPPLVGDPGAVPSRRTRARRSRTAAQQLELARAELRALELRLKPEHPDIGRAKRVIAELEAKAEAEALQQPLSAVTPGAGAQPGRRSRRGGACRADARRDRRKSAQRIDSGRREIGPPAGRRLPT